MDYTEKGRLFESARRELARCYQISLTEQQFNLWYAEYADGIHDMRAVLGAMEIAAHIERGKAVIAEGERRGGDRSKVSGSPTLSPMEKLVRHHDRMLGANKAIAKRYIKDTLRAGAIPSVTGALELIKRQANKKQAKPQVRLSSESQCDAKIIEGDCLTVMRGIPDRSVDLILCDLPYGTTQNEWDSTIPLDRLWEQYERIIKANGAIILTSQGPFTGTLINSNRKLFKYKLAWIKSKPTNFLNVKNQPLRKHEDICIFYERQPVYNPQMCLGQPYDKGHRKQQLTGAYGVFDSAHVQSEGDRYPTDVVYCKTAEAEGEVYHPAQKPVELGRYLIRTYTNSGALILDNACGSGSFLVAAKLEGRTFIGIESAPDYIRTARNRALS